MINPLGLIKGNADKSRCTLRAKKHYSPETLLWDDQMSSWKLADVYQGHTQVVDPPEGKRHTTMEGK